MGASRGARRSYTYARRSCRGGSKRCCRPRRCKPSGPQRPPGSNGRCRRTQKRAWCDRWSGRPRPTRRPSNEPRSCNRSSCSQSRGYPNRYPSSRQSCVAPYIHSCILANPYARTEAGRVATSHVRSVEPDGTHGRHRCRWHVDSHAGDCTPRMLQIKRFFFN